MKISDLHPSYQTALVTHEALRRAGVPAEDIYLVVAVAESQLVVRAVQGSSEVNFGVGEIPSELTKDAWASATTAFNEAPEVDLDALWERCAVDFPALVANLTQEGFLLPGSETFRNAAEA